MRRRWLAVMTAGLILGGFELVAAAHEHKVPPGPILERHELMEHNGRDAKAIGDAMKVGDMAKVAHAADSIAADSTKITALFPAGSTHPHSRAKDDIWQNWTQFEADAKEAHTTATALATAAREKGDVAAASKALFAACKGCHERFRKPEEKHKSPD